MVAAGLFFEFCKVLLITTCYEMLYKETLAAQEA